MTDIAIPRDKAGAETALKTLPSPAIRYVGDGMRRANLLDPGASILREIECHMQLQKESRVVLIKLARNVRWTQEHQDSWKFHHKVCAHETNELNRKLQLPEISKPKMDHSWQ